MTSNYVQIANVNFFAPLRDSTSGCYASSIGSHSTGKLTERAMKHS